MPKTLTLFKLAAYLCSLCLASAAPAALITEDFEGSSDGSTTPPAGWSLVIVDADPQAGYLTTTGNGGTLGGQITGNHASAGNNIVGAYFVNSVSVAFDASQPISGSFDFRINDIGNYSNVHFMMGNIQTGITETTAGEMLSLKLMKNTFGNRGGVIDGAGVQLATTTTQQLNANTWYPLTFTWTPSSGTSGIFSYTANNVTSTLTSDFSFDSSEVWFGFGAAGYSGNDTLGTFDNISITGSVIPEPSTVVLWLSGLLIASTRRRTGGA